MANADSTSSTTDTADDENMFKILVATDIHLGYAEKDCIRGDDSFNTFEEILQIAVKKDVDFILLGGDLFHDSKPTVSSLSRCMSLLRHYCMGNKPIGVEFMSDAADNFPDSTNPCVNYMDPNLNVSYPVYSINGNHDDFLGYNGKCSLDMLSSAGLVNYFGRQMDMNHLALSPLLLKKGTTHLAIYGLGFIKDKMLHRLLRQDKVTLLRPENEDFFNLLVLHQNRSGHLKDEYVPESFLPSFMQLVIWGHEHECRITPEFNEEKGFYVSQPGSSVATSLNESESRLKHVGLLRVKNGQMRMQKIRLKTVRPFVFRHVKLADHLQDVPTRKAETAVQNFLEREVESMLAEAQALLTGHAKQPTQPLIRLRVEFDDPDQLFNAVRFGIQFQGQVANPNDLILMKPSAKLKQRGPQNVDIVDENAYSNTANLNLHTVEEFIQTYFNECDADCQMKVLSVTAMNDAMNEYLNKNDTQALADIIEWEAVNAEEYLMSKDVDESGIDMLLEDRKIEREQNPDQEARKVRDLLANDKTRTRIRADADPDDITIDDDFFDENGAVVPAPAPVPARGRGSRGGRGSRRAAAAPRGGARGRGRGRGTNAVPSDDDDVIEVPDSPPARPARGRGSRGGRAAANKTATPRTSLNSSTSSVNSQAERSKRPNAGNRMKVFLDDTDSD